MKTGIFFILLCLILPALSCDSTNAQVRRADMALPDGTFYKNGGLPGRDMKEVSHPFVEESLQWFSSLSSAEKSEIVFIHFNHTNPLLKKESAEKKKIKEDGFAVAEEGMITELQDKNQRLLYVIS